MRGEEATLEDTWVRSEEGEAAAKDGDCVGDCRWEKRFWRCGRGEVGGEAETVAGGCVEVCGGEE